MPVSDAIEEGRLRRARNSGDVTAMRITFETTEAARRADYADAVRQIEESRRLIEQSQTLLAFGAIQMVRSEESLAEARRLLAMVNAALKARDADSTDAVVTAREAGPRR
jgi:hypothetical protein